ncbi:MAG TPA: antitoxin Xre/MbcA/ParS toxin-binding domain-containing protein [Burkholderiales bacterium]|nr:antitoxin Xre/MbcA/ParS toxin-binding domain-containing protein [Burkholderiales bacterium]
MARTPRPASRPEPAPDLVLTRAVLRAAELLGLSSAVLARVLGVSEASVSRLGGGARTVDPKSKEGELALLLVRVYRSLDALVGTDASQRHAWLHGHNRALNGRPIDLIQRTDGLVNVVAYLDAMRAPA